MLGVASARIRGTALGLVLAIAVAGTGLHGVAATPQGGRAPTSADHTSASRYCPTGEELVFLDLINDFRADNGLGPLRISRTLGAAAEHHSQDMARYNYFSHSLANGNSWATNITAHGYSSKYAIAENIAAGYRTARSTFNQWVNSSGHRANMLSSNYAAIGIGRASKGTSTYGYYWTTTFGGQFDSSPACF